MAHGDEAPERIVWSQEAPEGRTDRDLEQDLRSFCERSDRVPPELGRDVSFWLDLGQPPREVARWLRDELEHGPDSTTYAGWRDRTTSPLPPGQRRDAENVQRRRVKRT